MSTPVSWSVNNSQDLGGSQSEEFVGGDSRYGIYMPGVKAVYPSAKKIIRCRVLPARDLSLSVNDAAFAESFIQYRDSGSPRIDEDTKSPAFTSWYTMIVEYTMIGNLKTSVLSPITLQRLGVQGADVRDPYNIVRKYAKDNARWAHLLEQKLGVGKNSTDILPKLKFSGLMNVLAFDPQTNAPDNALMKLSLTALKDLKGKLTAPRPAAQQPVTNDEWANMFMLGDITSPLYGLMATVQSTQLGTISTAAMHFSQSAFLLQGHQSFAIDPNSPFGKSVLAGRYNFFSDKVLKILPFQDLVELMVADGSIPYDLIQEALCNVCAVPARPANAPSAVSSPGASPGGFAPPPQAFVPPPVAAPAQQAFNPPTPQQQAQAWAPPAVQQVSGQASPVVSATTLAQATNPPASQPAAWTPPPPPVQQTAWVPPPPPAPVAPVVKYYVVENGQTVSTNQDGINRLFVTAPTTSAIREGETTWKTVSDFASKVTPAVTPPYTPPPPAYVAPQPQVQQAPVQPPTQGFAAGPATPPVSTAVPGVPNTNKLSPEQQTKLESLIATISSGQTLAPEQLAEYASLIRTANS